MTGERSRIFPVAVSGPALLPGVARSSRWFALAALALSLFASLELIATAAAVRTASAWSPRLAGSVTVAVSGGWLESTEAAAARAMEVLGHAPGVAQIKLLDPHPSDALAGRVMGLPGGAGGSEPPRLIAATLASAYKGSAAALVQDLRRENIGAAIDDHGAWSGPVERTALIAAAAAAGALIVMAAVTGVFAAATAGGTIRAKSSRVSLLLHLGASDDMILAPVRRGVAGAAAAGALVGSGIAVILAALPGSVAVETWLTSRTGAGAGIGSGADIWSLAAAALWPPAAALVALWAGSVAASARLRALA